jgi:regulator of protease activity HflC (stomatin/prohibitin superfamily)
MYPRLAKTLLLGALLCSPLLTGCYTYVEPGFVGITVDCYGDEKGVQDYVLETGRVWYNPWTEVVYEYPTYMQNRVWSGNMLEGGLTGGPLTFNSSEGATITADVGLNYTLNRDKVPALFVEFRKELDVITDSYLRNQVRDAFNMVGGQYKAMDIFGGRKQEFLDEVKRNLETKLGERAFQIDSISIIGSPRAEDRVMASINAGVEATQRAIEAENKVRQIEAEAQQAIAKAKGEAESELTRAKAAAEANQLVAKSLTPALVQYKLLEKWDGTAPKVMGGETGMLLNMSAE